MSPFLQEALTSIQDFIHAHATMLAWVGGITTALSILGILAVPKVLCLLPEDYFLKLGSPPSQTHLPTKRILLNLAGLLIVGIGIVLCLVPGQGLLTILLGLLVMHFPGKEKLILRLVCRPSCGKALNCIRKKGSRPPFDFPPARVTDS